MASWDGEYFEPADMDTKMELNDKWEGEDDDDDVADNWDDDEEEEDKKAQVPASVPKKKKPLAERIKEKEEMRRQERLAKEEERKKLEEESQQQLTPEGQLAEKLRQQRLQEESDLQLAKEAFGISETIPGVKTIDNFDPSTKEEFTEFASMITQKFQKLEGRAEYQQFLETLFRDCCTSLEADEIKKISSSLNLLASSGTYAYKSMVSITPTPIL